MKKLVLTYGIIGGLIVSLFLTFAVASGVDHMDSNIAMILGFGGMIIAFSFIFVAIKKYRDQHSGFITFANAFKIGLYITLIASTMYVVTWLIDYYFFVPDFMEKYAANYLEGMKQAGKSQAEIAKTSAEMAEFAEMYKNPFFNALVTYGEIVPMGLIISLLAAAILKKKPQPAL